MARLYIPEAIVRQMPTPELEAITDEVDAYVDATLDAAEQELEARDLDQHDPHFSA